MKRLLSLLALVLAMGGLFPATSASAAPVGGPLYDATLFCGARFATQVDYSMPMGGGGTIWISTPGEFYGKWQHQQSQHFLLLDALATKPVSLSKLAKAPYQDMGIEVYGSKSGLAEQASCQIVSRWPAGTLEPIDLTVFGVMWLVR